MTYKILWLDDEFGTHGMDSIFDDFEEGRREGRFSEFEVTRCSTYDELEAYFDAGMYDAVILDVIGRVSEGDARINDRPFNKAIDFLKDRNVIIKVFSGDPEKSVTEGSPIMLMEEMGWQKDRDYFFKQGSYFALFKALQKDLGKKMHIYRNREYLRDMFSPDRQYLPAKDQKHVELLLDAFVSQRADFGSPDFKCLRELFQDILESLVYTDKTSRLPHQMIAEDRIVDRDGKHIDAGTEGRLGVLTYQVSRLTVPKDEKHLRFALDMIPFIKEACNKFNHSGDYNAEMLESHLSIGDYMMTVYHAFLVVLSWYYNTRERCASCPETGTGLA